MILFRVGGGKINVSVIRKRCETILLKWRNEKEWMKIDCQFKNLNFRTPDSCNHPIAIFGFLYDPLADRYDNLCFYKWVAGRRA